MRHLSYLFLILSIQMLCAENSFSDYHFSVAMNSERGQETKGHPEDRQELDRSIKSFNLSAHLNPIKINSKPFDEAVFFSRSTSLYLSSYSDSYTYENFKYPGPNLPPEKLTLKRKQIGAYTFWGDVKLGVEYSDYFNNDQYSIRSAYYLSDNNAISFELGLNDMTDDSKPIVGIAYQHFIDAKLHDFKFEASYRDTGQLSLTDIEAIVYITPKFSLTAGYQHWSGEDRLQGEIYRSRIKYYFSERLAVNFRWQINDTITQSRTGLIGLGISAHL